MIPINELQAKIYQTLSELDVGVYDEVVEDAPMPLISIGDYILSTIDCKGYGFSFIWTLNVYTDYEGKKEVNELVSKVIECMYGLNNINLSEDYSINDVILDSANISRNEGYYIANLNMRIEIN